MFSCLLRFLVLGIRNCLIQQHWQFKRQSADANKFDSHAMIVYDCVH